MTYAYAKMHGYLWLLAKWDGTIKAIGMTRRVVEMSRNRKDGDRVLPLEEYRALYPDAR